MQNESGNNHNIEMSMKFDAWKINDSSFITNYSIHGITHYISDYNFLPYNKLFILTQNTPWSIHFRCYLSDLDLNMTFI